MALRLLIESSLSGFGIGLSSIDDFDSPCSLSACLFNSKQNSSADSLAGGIQSLFKEEGCRWEDLEEVIVSNGPGSFTGIRIGLAYVYGLAMGRPDLRVQGVCGLSLLRDALLRGEEDVNLQPGSFHVLLPQTQSHGFFLSSLQTPKRAGDLPIILNYQDIVQSLEDSEAEKLIYIPELRFAEEARALLVGNGIEVRFLAPESVLLLSLQGMSKMARIVRNQSLPEPQYRRLSSAEERLKF